MFSADDDAEDEIAALNRIDAAAFTLDDTSVIAICTTSDDDGESFR